MATGHGARPPARPAGQPGPPPRAAEPGHDLDASVLTGVDLIQRTLGGQVIEEIGDA